MRKILKFPSVKHHYEYRGYLTASNTVSYIFQMSFWRDFCFSYSMLHAPCEIPFSITEIFFHLLFYLRLFFPSIKNTYSFCDLCVTEALTQPTLVPELWLQAHPRPYCINIIIIALSDISSLGKGYSFMFRELNPNLCLVTGCCGKHKHQQEATKSKALQNKCETRVIYLTCNPVLS